MENKKKLHVCPVERAGSLDLKIRRLIQNPEKILGQYVSPGMTVMDVGCGPGFFILDMARMVGPNGRVIAVDLQDGMLEKVRAKVNGTEIAKRITLHKCEENEIGTTEKADFVLLFYMVHEVPNQRSLFEELASLLNSGGRILMVEPPFHVGKKAFERSIQIAESAGLSVVERPKMIFNKAVVLKKGPSNKNIAG
jgi:ubiquinone/menaquinone biosynthesis C-methylase UbiE